jgi:hypothetical protein
MKFIEDKIDLYITPRDFGLWNETDTSYEKKNFTEWLKKTNNTDVMEEESLKEILETIEQFTRESYEYKWPEEVGPEESSFQCRHYAREYVRVFDELKEINPNLKNVHAFYVRWAGVSSEDSGHAFVGLLSISDDSIYASFLDPTWSDDPEFNRMDFDAIDNQHFLEIDPDQIPEEYLDKE